jgi:hypothetical protein
MIEDIFLVMHRRGRDRANVARVADALVDLFKRKKKTLIGC